MCHSPKYYNIKVLPPELKVAVREHYQTYIDWAQNSDEINDHVRKHFIKLAVGTVKFMESEDYHDKTAWDDKTWLDELVINTTKLDEIRGQNILDVVPQYGDLFNAYNK